MFDENYYVELMKEFNYDPLSFGRIDFGLGKLSSEDLQRRWLCHHDANKFSEDNNNGKKCIVSTGFGLSGVPHAGTLSQILRAIAIHESGIPVNMVLGDLDAYNGKGVPLQKTLELAEKYRKFVTKLGFSEKDGSILRSQYDATDVLRTAYLIGHYMNEEMFHKAEEDLHSFYKERGKVDSEMSYRRKLSLNLMTADFIHLHMDLGFDSVLVMLGIDEHKYVQFAKETIENISDHEKIPEFTMNLGGMYSSIIKGFHEYPKMSKSFPESGITLDMDPDIIRERLFNGEGTYDKPENNVVYQMIAAASRFDANEVKEAYDACQNRGNNWNKTKQKYLDDLVALSSLWRSI